MNNTKIIFALALLVAAPCFGMEMGGEPDKSDDESVKCGSDSRPGNKKSKISFELLEVFRYVHYSGTGLETSSRETYNTVTSITDVSIQEALKLLNPPNKNDFCTTGLTISQAIPHIASAFRTARLHEHTTSTCCH